MENHKVSSSSTDQLMCRTPHEALLIAQNSSNLLKHIAQNYLKLFKLDQTIVQTRFKILQNLVKTCQTCLNIAQTCSKLFNIVQNDSKSVKNTNTLLIIDCVFRHNNQ